MKTFFQKKPGFFNRFTFEPKSERKAKDVSILNAFTFTLPEKF